MRISNAAAAVFCSSDSDLCSSSSAAWCCSSACSSASCTTVLYAVVPTGRGKQLPLSERSLSCTPFCPRSCRLSCSLCPCERSPSRRHARTTACRLRRHCRCPVTNQTRTQTIMGSVPVGDAVASRAAARRLGIGVCGKIRRGIRRQANTELWRKLEAAPSAPSKSMLRPWMGFVRSVLGALVLFFATMFRGKSQFSKRYAEYMRPRGCPYGSPHWLHPRRGRSSSESRS